VTSQLERYVELIEYANKLATERDALATELKGVDGMLNQSVARIRELEAALREIADGRPDERVCTSHVEAIEIALKALHPLVPETETKGDASGT
jgi:hypothetical protein